MRCRTLRCLIVDDSVGFRDAARMMLERSGVAVVGAASNSAEALERFAELRPDVTLVDVDLGAESGFDLVARLCRMESTAPSPVILMSSHAEQDFLELIASSPAVGFLSKLDLTFEAIVDLACRHDTFCGSVTEPPDM